MTLFRYAIGPLQYIAVATFIVLSGLTILLVAEDAPYARYTALESTDYLKVRWIYERLNFDPTPVDIAFLGSSRTMQGIDSERIERAINAGASTPYHVVNLGLPSLGRDVPFLVGRMLLEKKKPKIIFVEIDYLNDRHGSPIYPQLATFEDFKDAPVLNAAVFNDAVTLATRHGRLLWSSMFDGIQFDPGRYRGEHWDDDYATTGANGHLSPPRLNAMDEERLIREAALWVSLREKKAAEYKNWAWAQLYYNEQYEQRLFSLAQAAGAKIVLLYMAAIGSPDKPFHYEEFERYGDILGIPENITGDHAAWINPTHMNFRGATKYSDWLAAKLRQDYLDK